MEFERAIFRVYERCMESLHDDGEDGMENINIKTCRVIEMIALLAGLFLLFCLLYLHVIFVGSAGCLPNQLSVLNTVHYVNSTSNSSSSPKTLIAINEKFELKNDQILSIRIDRSDSKSNYHLRSSKSMSDDAMENRILSEHPMNSPLLNSFVKGLNNSVLSANSTTTIHEESLLKSQFDYLFAFDPYVLLLPDSVKKSHHFSTVNVTISGEQCFGGIFTQSVLSLAGMDSILVNNLMYTFRKPGYLLVSSTEDLYRWSEEDIDPYYLSRFKTTHSAQRYSMFGLWVRMKINILFESLFSFFLLSSVTALLVRMLISSGVVLLFPIFWLFQLLGMHAINIRIISLSYPWIGIPMEILRTRNQSSTPFILGHISRVVVYYCLYAAAQVAFSSWFYDKDSPSQQELWLCAVMMLWEYYSMIYVRSSGCIQLFPRASLALFLVYHFYYFSFPSGLHLLALSAMSLLQLYLMILCVRIFEVKSFHQGRVSIDQPRAYYTSLPWPSWRAELAPEFSLFMPLSNRSINIYQDNIPARPGDNSPAGGGDGNAAAATAAPATAAPPTGGASPSGAAENGSSSDTESGIGQVEMSSQRVSTSNPLHADSSSASGITGSATTGAESKKGRIQSALQSITSRVSNLRNMAYAPPSSSSGGGSGSSIINSGGTNSTWIPSNASLKYQKISDNSVHSSSIMGEKLAAEDSEVEAGFQEEAEDEESGHRGRDKSDSEQGQKKKVYHI